MLIKAENTLGHIVLINPNEIVSLYPHWSVDSTERDPESYNVTFKTHVIYIKKIPAELMDYTNNNNEERKSENA